MTPPPSVSVVVVHYEQPRQLARTLMALSRQRYAGELEVIVVDDGSREPPVVPDGVALVIQDRDGARRSAARNRGVHASRGAILCFLDADTAPEPDYIAELTRLPALEAEALTVGRRRHARFDDVGLDADLASAGAAHELASPRWLADGYAASRDLADADPRSFRYVISAVLACTRGFYDEVGGFDETFAAYGGEDWEWAHRAWLRGATFAHVPAAVAWHDGPAWEARAADAEAGADARARAQAARAEKNAEAMRLAPLISVPGHRPRGLLGARAETVIDLDGAIGPAATFVCVDSLLAALPSAAVRVPEAMAAWFVADPRVVRAGDGNSERVAWPALYLRVHTAVTILGAALADLCRAMLDADDGRWHLRDADGELITLESARHRARVARRGESAGLPVHEGRPDWLARMADPPDVEAYLGGWQR